MRLPLVEAQLARRIAQTLENQRAPKKRKARRGRSRERPADKSAVLKVETHRFPVYTAGRADASGRIVASPRAIALTRSRRYL